MDEQRGLDAWAAIEEAHNDRVQTLATLMLARGFSDRARLEALKAESRLMRAQREAEQARSFLQRTTETLEQAIRLHAMGRM